MPVNSAQRHPSLWLALPASRATVSFHRIGFILSMADKDSLFFFGIHIIIVTA